MTVPPQRHEEHSPTVLEALAALPVELQVALTPPSPELDLAERRAVVRAQLEVMHAELAEPGLAVGAIDEVRLDSVDLRIYHPYGTTETVRPAFVFVHGGGWWQGWIDSPTTDTTCRERCARGDVVVISVGYRKAPEHRYPAGLDDVVTALNWVHDHAQELGIDPRRIGVGGQSAGANLAAAAALRAREAGGPPLALLLLEVPALDLTLERAAALASLGELDGLHEGVDLYLNAAHDASDPWASPLLAPDLTGLPPTHVMVAGLDALRRDGLDFADRLCEAGVVATSTTYPQHLHASPMLTKLLPEARRWRDEVVAMTARLHSLGDTEPSDPERDETVLAPPVTN